jgi:hypothetical protein
MGILATQSRRATDKVRADREFEDRWAEEQYDRLPALSADLVGRRVAVGTTETPRDDPSSSAADG